MRGNALSARLMLLSQQSPCIGKASSRKSARKPAKVRAVRCIIFALVLTGCGDHKPAPTVVIDDWWNVDYAKQSCNTQPEDAKAGCLLDATYNAHEFENEVLGAAGSDSSCAGVKIVVWNLESKEAIPMPDWTLYIDYAGDAPRQHWSLLRQSSRVAMLEGTNAPKELAHMLCAIALNKGAMVNN
jgi:hypothetical protein